MSLDELSKRTVKDFGAQWTLWRENDGYYASTDMFRDLFEPLLHVDALRGRFVAEIGSGTGRIVNALLDLGVREIVAVEPSDAMAVLRNNTSERANQIRYLPVTGDLLPGISTLIT